MSTVNLILLNLNIITIMTNMANAHDTEKNILFYKKSQYIIFGKDL